MNNRAEAKKKLLIFEQPGSHQVVIDALRMFDEELGMITTDVKDDWYLFYVNKLKYRYQQELNKTEVKDSIQIDLEDSIREIKEKRSV